MTRDTETGLGGTAAQGRTTPLSVPISGQPVNPPILTVNDPRMDTKEHWKRRKVLAALGKLLPASVAPTECATHGHMPPYDQGDPRVKYPPGTNGNYKFLLVGDLFNSCTAFNASVMALIRASGVWGFKIQYGADDDGTGKQRPQDGWVSYAPGLLPSVGDVFILYQGKSPHHCGVVCEVSVDDVNGIKLWITGDGGQPDRTGALHRDANGQWKRSYGTPGLSYPPDQPAQPDYVERSREAAFLVPRTFDRSDPTNPLLANFFTGGGGETLHGWRNVTHPKISMQTLGKPKGSGSEHEHRNPSDDDYMTGSEDDYQSLKSRINAMRGVVIAEARYRAATPASPPASPRAIPRP